jgi:hypothetical protein
MGNTVVECRTAEMEALMGEGVEKTDCESTSAELPTSGMILSILLVERMRQEAFVFSQIIWMGVVHLKFQMKFCLYSFALIF